MEGVFQYNSIPSGESRSCYVMLTISSFRPILVLSRVNDYEVGVNLVKTYFLEPNTDVVSM